MEEINYSKLKVLIVEDEAFTRTLIRRLLRELGVQSISEKSNGKDGLMEVVRTRPDLVLCDVHMAPMNGRQFLQGVREIKVKAINQTPVIFLTADSGKATVLFAKEHGVNGYIVKPVSLTRLRTTLDTVVLSDPILAELCRGFGQT